MRYRVNKVAVHVEIYDPLFGDRVVDFDWAPEWDDPLVYMLMQRYVEQQAALAKKEPPGAIV